MQTTMNTLMRSPSSQVRPRFSAVDENLPDPLLDIVRTKQPQTEESRKSSTVLALIGTAILSLIIGTAWGVAVGSRNSGMYQPPVSTPTAPQK